MKINGRGHCGQITYQALVDPARVAICHCTDRQSLTGTAYRVSVPARIDDLTLQTGRPAVYTWLATPSVRDRAAALVRPRRHREPRGSA